MTKILIDRAVVQRLLHAIDPTDGGADLLRAALREALAQPQAEPAGWEHLKSFGYAPGNYMGRCHTCNEIVSDVDKRAITCRPCAEMLYAGKNVEAQPATQQDNVCSECGCHHTVGGPIDSEWIARREQAAYEAGRASQPATQKDGEPVAIVEVVVPHLESIVVKHIQGAPFPKVGDFFYTTPQPTAPAGEPVATLLVNRDSEGRWMQIAPNVHADTLPFGDYKLYIHPQPRKQLAPEQIHKLDPLPHQMFDAQRIEFARAVIAEYERINGIGGQA